MAYNELIDLGDAVGDISPAFCLETGMKADQEGMIRGLLKYMLFCLDPIDVLVKKLK